MFLAAIVGVTIPVTLSVWLSNQSSEDIALTAGVPLFAAYLVARVLAIYVSRVQDSYREPEQPSPNALLLGRALALLIFAGVVVSLSGLAYLGLRLQAAFETASWTTLGCGLAIVAVIISSGRPDIASYQTPDSVMSGDGAIAIARDSRRVVVAAATAEMFRWGVALRSIAVIHR